MTREKLLDQQNKATIYQELQKKTALSTSNLEKHKLKDLHRILKKTEDKLIYFTSKSESLSTLNTELHNTIAEGEVELKNEKERGMISLKAEKDHSKGVLKAVQVKAAKSIAVAELEKKNIAKELVIFKKKTSVIQEQQSILFRERVKEKNKQ